MVIRIIFLTAIIVLALSAAWSKREQLEALLEPDRVVKPIVFDNGTVRQYMPSASSDQADLPAGTLRKCVSKGEVTYTNVPCPKGHKEKPVAGPPVNVVAGQVVQAAKQPAVNGAKGTSALHDALDLSSDGQLKERIMERAIKGQP